MSTSDKIHSEKDLEHKQENQQCSTDKTHSNVYLVLKFILIRQKQKMKHQLQM